MESGDLVVVQIGDDESLSSKRSFDLTNAVGGNTVFGEAIAIRITIVAQRGHDDRFAAKRAQIVGNVAGATAPFAAHFANLEAHRKDVRLLRKNVARKAVRKHHDGVVRERAADQCAHERSGGPAGRKTIWRGEVYRGRRFVALRSYLGTAITRRRR